jgi:hypothetical protein
MRYPTGNDARRAVVRLMSLSRRLDARMVVESTPAQGDYDYELMSAAYFFIHLIRIERVMFSLADGSVGFDSHKVLSSSAATRLRDLERAMDAYAVTPPPEQAHLRQAPLPLHHHVAGRVHGLFDVRAWLANVLLFM